MEPWDPSTVPLSAAVPATCLGRIRRDLQALAESPLDGIIVSPDDTSALKFQALVLGSEGTPYHGGFFLFNGAFPPDYPASPPKLRLMTTGGGTTRMGPNLYASGKVCLSILGTWAGDPWTPTLTVGNVLMSIQAMLMTKDALRNEPGQDKTSDVAKVEFYDAVIQHHVISIAVIDTVSRVINSLKESLGMKDESESSGADAGAGGSATSKAKATTTAKSDLPRDLQEAVLNSFISLSDSYLESCDTLATRYTGAFEDPMWKDPTNPRKFAWKEMRDRISDVLLPAALDVSEALEKEAAEAEAGEAEA
jgi:ubiquitin-protein ligase